MGLFRNSETRHLVCDGIRTCIAMEPQFWQVADDRAASVGLPWHEWVTVRLDAMPAGMSRARWLRVAILAAAIGPSDGAGSNQLRSTERVN